MRLYIDRPDVLTPGRWHFCPPGARLVPMPHAFGSRIWDPKGETDDPPIGEVAPRGPWFRGTGKPQWDGQHICGSAEVWLHGILYADRPGLPIGPDGYPTCCGSLRTIDARLAIVGTASLRDWPSFMTGPNIGGGTIPYFNGGGGRGPGGFPATGKSLEIVAALLFAGGSSLPVAAPLAITAAVDLLTGPETSTPAPLAIVATVDMALTPLMATSAPLAITAAVDLLTGPDVVVHAPLAIVGTVGLLPVSSDTVAAPLALVGLVALLTGAPLYRTPAPLAITGSVSFAVPPYTTFDILAPLAIRGTVDEGPVGPRTYRSPGLYVVPPGISTLMLECWGAGADGGPGDFTSSGGGGGGGGAYARTHITVSPGDTITIYMDADVTWASASGTPPVVDTDGAAAGGASHPVGQVGGFNGVAITFESLGGQNGSTGGDGGTVFFDGGGGSSAQDSSAGGIGGTDGDHGGAGGLNALGNGGDGGDLSTAPGDGSGFGAGGGGAYVTNPFPPGAGTGGAVIVTPM